MCSSDLTGLQCQFPSLRLFMRHRLAYAMASYPEISAATRAHFFFPLEPGAHQDSAPAKHWRAWKEEEEGQGREEEAQSPAIFRRTSMIPILKTFPWGFSSDISNSDPWASSSSSTKHTTRHTAWTRWRPAVTSQWAMNEHVSVLVRKQKPIIEIELRTTSI